jgi:hypothetical protein
VQFLPDTGSLPVTQPPPTRHATAAAHLLRQHLPGNATFEDKQNSGQRHPIADRRTPSAWAGLMLGKYVVQSPSKVHPTQVAQPSLGSSLHTRVLQSLAFLIPHILPSASIEVLIGALRLNDIISRRLDLAVPPGATTDQTKALRDLVSYGIQNGVTVRILVIP